MAKIVYENLLKFTDDPLVQDTLRFLMTREIAHFQQFGAALSTIDPNKVRIELPQVDLPPPIDFGPPAK